MHFVGTLCACRGGHHKVEWQSRSFMRWTTVSFPAADGPEMTISKGSVRGLSNLAGSIPCRYFTKDARTGLQ